MSELVQIGDAAPKSAPSSPHRWETPRLVLTLGLAGMLSGLAIVGAYEVTRPMIEANQAKALREAVFKVVPGAATLRQLVWENGQLTPGETPGVPSVYGAYAEDGTFQGYAVPAEGAGYQDTIRLLYGFDPTRQRVTGMEVLESRETPGLGDKIFKDMAFVEQFHDLAVDPEVVLVKGGRSAPNEVDGITGATVSSRAVVRIINDAHAEWKERLPHEP